MKRFLNIFYTTPFKLMLFIAVAVCIWNMNNCTLETIDLYSEDSTALLNVLKQGEEYDYQSSYFLENDIKQTIKNVLEYSLVYSVQEEGAIDLPENYRRSIDKGYGANAEYMEGLENLIFAVVNHSEDTVISNIEEINGKKSDIQVRKHFGNNDKTLLIVRQAKTPLYEQGTMTDYVEEVAKLAEEYEEDFDLYISFGDNFDFVSARDTYEERHTKSLGEMQNILKTVCPLGTLALLFALLYIFLTGKYEPGGKYYGVLFDRIPNDLVLGMYIIIFFSMTALYENSIYMAFRASMDENYWINFPIEYYKIRANICIVTYVIISIGIVSTVKRQYRMKTLLTNTYLYRTFKSYKCSKA